MSEPTAAEVKEQLLAVAKEMLHRRDSWRAPPATSSARLPDGNVVLTPSSLDYGRWTSTISSCVDLDGNVVEGHRGPTTEKALHLACLRRYPEVDAVMHCHAKHCTMFALAREPIPAVIEEFVVYVGGDVPVANYETTGTDELARGGRRMGRRPEPRCSWPTTDCSRWARTRPTSCTSRGWSSARPRSCGARSASGEIVPLPPETNTQFAGYYRYGRTGKF